MLSPASTRSRPGAGPASAVETAGADLDLPPTSPPALAGRLRAGASHALLLTPGLLLAVLAVLSGGYSPTWTGVGAVLVLLLLVLRVTLADEPWTASGPATVVAGGALALFALVSLVSAEWSDSPARALLEYNRLLLYLAVFALFATFEPRPGHARVVLLGLGLGAIVVSLLALLAWLMPDALTPNEPVSRLRLSWPTSYWNAIGLLAILGFLWCVALSAASEVSGRTRLAAAAALPALAAVAYFSVSRGAVAAGAVGLAVLIALAPPAARVTIVPLALIGGGLGFLIADSTSGLAAAEPSAAAREDGRRAGAMLVGAAVMLMLVRVLLARVVARLVRKSRARKPGRVRIATAIFGAAALTCAFVVVGGVPVAQDAVHSFASGSSVPPTADPSDRFLRLGGNGRTDLWDVALTDGFAPRPALGAGAGTYALQWARERESSFAVVDAHSLYLETLAELGVIGGALLAVFLGGILIALFARAWRTRSLLWAGLAATTAAWAVRAGFDWDWEMPALTAWVFAAGGLALATTRTRPRTPSRTPRVVAGLACLLLALVPLQVARSQSELAGALDAFRAGDCRTAIDRSLRATDALRARPEPFELLAYCDLRTGREELAQRAIDAAIRRDPRNWEFHYAKAIIVGASGGDPRQAARRARRLNPLHPYVRRLARRYEEGSRRSWRKAARTAPLNLPSTNPPD